MILVISLVEKVKSLSNLDRFMNLKHHFTPDKNFPYFTQTIKSDKNGKIVKLTFQHTWLEQYKWLAYSLFQAGGFCKYTGVLRLATP